MRGNFNLWKGLAAAAVLFATGVGYVEASRLQTATHYNVTPLDDENQTPNWQPITPGSPGMNSCTPSSRACKAIQTSPGNFTVVEFGNL